MCEPLAACWPIFCRFSFYIQVTQTKKARHPADGATSVIYIRCLDGQ